MTLTVLWRPCHTATAWMLLPLPLYNQVRHDGPAGRPTTNTGIMAAKKSW